MIRVEYDQFWTDAGKSTPVMICTDERGTYDITRRRPRGLFAPAIELPALLNRRATGANDAHLAGVIQMHLNCPDGKSSNRVFTSGECWPYTSQAPTLQLGRPKIVRVAYCRHDTQAVLAA